MSNLHRLVRTSPYYFNEDDFVYDFESTLQMSEDESVDDEIYDADVDIDNYQHIVYGLASKLQASFLKKHNFDNCDCHKFFVHSIIVPPESYIVPENTPNPCIDFLLVIEHCERVFNSMSDHLQNLKNIKDSFMQSVEATFDFEKFEPFPLCAKHNLFEMISQHFIDIRIQIEVKNRTNSVTVTTDYSSPAAFANTRA